ncbi:insulinase family protein [Streptococcus suis]|nr:insulinase family protein [Streptococcus suis]MBY5021209.1 insulinase family protein [Streptococcus suis]
MEFTNHSYPFLKEVVFQGVLDSGLTVTLIPKSDFHETYAVLTTKFGAADLLEHEDKDFSPVGIAHFLEHKLFETESGDAMQEFARLGSSANAYTTLHHTSYLFSTTNNRMDSLQLLLSFTQEAHFTEESVEREKEIIAQEIEMYEDDPDHHLYTGILARLYPNTPLAFDIAGTVKSIQLITPQLLYRYFTMFYQPSNMHLCLVGQIEVEDTLEKLNELSRPFHFDKKNAPVIERVELEKLPILKHETEYFEVAMPKLAIGLRGNDKLDPSQLQTYRICLNLLFSMLIGWTSKRYQELYETGKIDASFHFYLDLHLDYHFLVITADTTEPIALSAVLRRAIQEFEQDPDISEEHLQLLKKEMYGDFIKSLNSLEALAGHMASLIGEEQSFFDTPAILEKVSLEDILEVGRKFIGQADMTDFVIFPK